jgi:raffinose/stachyose/melibiose transport system substrate-binding protein
LETNNLEEEIMAFRTVLMTTVAAVALGTATAGVAEEVTLSILIDSSADTVASTDALTAAYTAKHPEVTFEIEQRPGGGEGDNMVKTRLATGEIGDIFQYNSGSLFHALRPAQTMADISDQPAAAAVSDVYKPSVSADGKLYGVPYEAAMGGGILYNTKIYEQLGLSVPKTWDEFMANNAKIKEAGIVPIAQTYRDTWTSQLFVLADFFNVLAAAPTFADDYTANKAKYATTPAALRGFEHLQETYEAGLFNEDFGAASYDDGLRMIATGEAAHYPMLTFAIGAIQQNFPEELNDVGFFAQPGADATKNGLTVWMPAALYISAESENVDAAKGFLDFVASPEGCEILTQSIGATGPYLVEGCDLPADVPTAVKDMLPYFETEGATAPALEFLSPVKGPALEQITVEVGSGIRSAADAAALYDQDVEKQAKQLGLPEW